MKKKKLIIFDNKGQPASEYDVPRLVNEAHENKWATRLFRMFRKSARDKNKVDHWDIKTKEEEE